MTEDCVLPVCEQSAELAREREEGGVPDEIDAVVQPVQPACGEAVGDRSAAEALGSELCSGHEPALSRGDRGHGPVTMISTFRRFCMLVMQNLRSSNLRGHYRLGSRR